MCRNSMIKFKVEWFLLILTFFSVEHVDKMDNAYICNVVYKWIKLNKNGYVESINVLCADFKYSTSNPLCTEL